MTSLLDYNTLIVLIGVSVLGAGAGLVGTFAVLRRRALTGDALSHASLPGICLAFMLTGERRLFILLPGALLSGLAGVLVMSALRRWTRLKEDACVGIVLSVFFGAGLALKEIIMRGKTGGKAGLQSFILGKTAGMIAQDVYLIAGASFACLLAVLLLYKELKLVTFDPGFARVQGWPASLLDLLLMTLLAVTVMIGLPAVGAVLMAALVIAPGATARLWTDRLSVMLVLAALIGAVTGLIGTAISASYERMPAGPIIILVGTAFFLISLAFAPRHGLLARALARRRFERDIARRQFLRILYDAVEPHLPSRSEVTIDDLAARRSWPPQRLARFLASAAEERLLERVADGRYTLTPAGLEQAAEAARSHRLWTLFLTEHADVATGLVDLAEPSLSAVLPESLVEELTAQLQREGRWPVTSLSLEAGRG